MSYLRIIFLLSFYSVTGARAGAGLRAGLVAGLWVGQAYGMFYLPGFGLAVPAPWLLGTQPPFAR